MCHYTNERNIWRGLMAMVCTLAAVKWKWKKRKKKKLMEEKWMKLSPDRNLTFTSFFFSNGFNRKLMSSSGDWKIQPKQNGSTHEIACVNIQKIKIACSRFDRYCWIVQFASQNKQSPSRSTCWYKFVKYAIISIHKLIHRYKLPNYTKSIVIESIFNKHANQLIMTVHSSLHRQINDEIK